MTAASYESVPPTPKQADYARAIAARLNTVIPRESVADRRALSEWISRNQSQGKPYLQGRGATSRQVAYAERIAARKRLAVPDECFRDSGLMSRWIDCNR